jgi:hypothetical protein
MSFSAGQVLLASQLNAELVRELAFAERTSDSSGSASTTPVSVERLDSIAIESGFSFYVCTSPLIFDSTVANDLAALSVYTSTAGAATSASTMLTQLVTPSYSASANQPTKGLRIPYRSATTGTLSILLTVHRATGTGTVKIKASSQIPLRFWVEAGGTSANDTGVDL